MDCSFEIINNILKNGCNNKILNISIIKRLQIVGYRFTSEDIRSVIDYNDTKIIKLLASYLSNDDRIILLKRKGYTNEQLENIDTKEIQFLSYK